MTLTRISDSTERYRTSASTDAQLHEGARYGFALVDGRSLACLHSGTYHCRSLNKSRLYKPAKYSSSRTCCIRCAISDNAINLSSCFVKHAPMYDSIIICQPNSSLGRDLKLRPWIQLGISFGCVASLSFKTPREFDLSHNVRPELLRYVPENTILCRPKQTWIPDQSKFVDLPQLKIDRAYHSILT